MTTMLLEWAAASVLLILAVLLLRAALGRRISASLRYALWGLVLLRLLVPVQLFTSPVVGVQVFSAPQPGQTQAVGAVPPAPVGAAPQAPEAGTAPGAVPVVPDAPQAPAAPAAPDLAALTPWLGWTWLAGSVAAGAVLLISNLRFAASLRRRRTPLEGADCPLPVYLAEGLPSPCLFGLFRPAVYVSPETAADPAALRHVLAHEYTHFRHLDHVWNLLRCAALAVHWWDPLVWLAAGLSRRDGELACDEGALKRLGDGERSGYGNTLLSLVTAQPGPGELFRCATTMAGDKRSLTERVKRIAHASRPAAWAAVLAVAALLLAGACAFSRVQAEEPAPTPTPTQDQSPAEEFTADGLRFVWGEGDGANEVYIHGLNGLSVDWGYGVGIYFSGDLAALCPELAGKEAQVSNAMWASEGELTTVAVVMDVGNGPLEEETPMTLVSFEVEPESGTVLRQASTPDDEGAALELTDGQMVQIARSAAALLRAAENFSLGRRAAALEAVLRDSGTFFLVSGGETAEMTLDDIAALFDPDDPYVKPQRYAAVDLDGDGANEYVIQVMGAAGDMGGWLILYADRETVYGYQLGCRAIEDLKADGTFSYSLPDGTEAGTRAIGYLYPSGYSASELSRARGTAWAWTQFQVDGETATEEEWLAAQAAQAEKPDAEWHDLP